MVGDIKKLLEAEKEQIADSKDSTNGDANGALNQGKFKITLVKKSVALIYYVYNINEVISMTYPLYLNHILILGEQRKRAFDDSAETTGMPVAKKPKNISVEEDGIVCID